MGIAYERGSVTLTGTVTVEDAEPLCGLLAAHPDAPLDLSGCEHLHTAALQVLLAARRALQFGPPSPFLQAALGVRGELSPPSSHPQEVP